MAPSPVEMANDNGEDVFSSTSKERKGISVDFLALKMSEDARLVTSLTFVRKTAAT